ncbi:hypothetical protein BJY52DRAFT_1421534, partial [Lactarius psammicola]
SLHWSRNLLTFAYPTFIYALPAALRSIFGLLLGLWYFAACLSTRKAIKRKI